MFLEYRLQHFGLAEDGEEGTANAYIQGITVVTSVPPGRMNEFGFTCCRYAFGSCSHTVTAGDAEKAQSHCHLY